jgi:cholesterol transport system auxiliary component
MNLRQAIPPALLALLLAASALVGCASAPGIPETTYHRLPPPAAVAALAQSAHLQIVVERLQADGLHADQSLLYALDSKGHRLRAYHYNLWAVPPGYLLQRRLIGRLRAAGASPRVTDHAPLRVQSLWLGGRILAFERVPRDGGGWDARVALQLRLDRRDGGLPLLEKTYRARVEAADDSLSASVAALSTAVDRVIAELLVELAPLLAEPQE